MSWKGPKGEHFALEQVHARYLIKNIIIDRCRRGVFDVGILQNGSNMAWVECHPDAIADLIGQVNNVGRYNLSCLESCTYCKTLNVFLMLRMVEY